jgi:hypothetical protein
VLKPRAAGVRYDHEVPASVDMAISPLESPAKTSFPLSTGKTADTFKAKGPGKGSHCRSEADGEEHENPVVRRATSNTTAARPAEVRERSASGIMVSHSPFTRRVRREKQ